MLGYTIMQYRKKLGLTQEQLANKLGVTNQAVSKWETDQCCPDVAVLPTLADIFGISIDMLFGRTPPQSVQTLPWKDDGQIHIVLYAGHRLIKENNARNYEYTIRYNGPARSVHCACNLNCGDVEGNIEAGGYVECGDVAGNLQCGSYVECGDVAGNLSAMSYVECGDVGGNVTAMSYVECGDVAGGVLSSG